MIQKKVIKNLLLLGVGVKLLRMTPLTHPAKKIDQMDSKNKDVG